MVIEYIKMKNIKGIYTSKHCENMEIDFSSRQNKICLFVGPNGSGKTTILSMMSPFGSVGNLDVRNTTSLIRKGKDGYKEIRISSGDDKYIIKHFYTPSKESHTVKSYISKNGVEMNNNGNVTSFLAYVKDEFGIDLDYLKLIRIGDNVSSIIKLSTTERKNFMAKLLDDIGVFLKYYKSMNAKLKQIKSYIAYNVEKINKLGIENKSEEKERIKKANIVLKDTEAEYEKSISEISVLMSKLSDFDSVQELQSSFKTLKATIDKMDRQLLKKDSYPSTDPEYYKKEIELVKSQISNCEVIKKTNDERYAFAIEEVDKLNAIYEDLTASYEKEKESEDELKRMRFNFLEKQKRLSSIMDELANFNPEYSKDDVENLIVFMKQSLLTFRKAQDYGYDVLDKLVELLLDKKDIPAYVDKHIVKLTKTESESNTRFLKELNNQFHFTEKPKFSCGDDVQCEAKVLWNKIYNIITSENEDDEKESIDFYQDLLMAYQTVYPVFTRFSEYSNTINALPSKLNKYFNVGNIYDAILKGVDYYDQSEFDELYRIMTDFEESKKLTIELDAMETDIARFESISHAGFIESQLATTKKSIKTYKNMLIDIDDSNTKNDPLLDELHRTEEYLIEALDLFENYDSIVQEFKETESSLEKVYEYQKDLSTATFTRDKQRDSIKKLRDYLDNRTHALKEYKSLNKDLKALNIAYEDIGHIVKSLSTKEGMPLEMIGDYLNDTLDITNDLLSIAYHGDKYVIDFNVQESSFDIPFMNNGEVLEDVRFASQGEISFLSLALSFALVTQSVANYNVLLLDEVDGPFDHENREKFIAILEKLIEIIHAEQVFLITHNDVFTSYPVDVVDLSMDKTHNTEYKLANKIPVKFY